MNILETCFFVSPNGCDDWSGRQPETDEGGKDGPFATLQKAIETARCSKDSEKKRIVLRGGSYYNNSIKFTAADSNLIIEAMCGEKPVIYGGRKITGWKKEETGELWYSELPEAISGQLDFRLLTVNRRMAKRSKLPETGTFQHSSIFDVEWMGTAAGGWERKPTLDELTTLRYKDNDLGVWFDTKSAEITVYHKWDESLAGIREHDPAKKQLRLSIPCGHPPGAFKVYDYVVWNTREGVKQPGQWYLDRTGGRLVYWPVAGENMEQAEVIAPTCDIIFSFEDKVENVEISGLELAVTNTPLKTPEFAAFRMTGAVQALEGLVNCRFANLKIENTGGHGIKLMGCCKAIVIENCEICNTGAGGILFQNNKQEVNKNGVELMQSCMDPGMEEDEPSSIIKDNHVHHAGLVYTSAIAIAGHNCNIVHNEVTDTPYSGICYGGLAGVSQSGRNARIEYNKVSRAMQVLNDGAAIYATFAVNGTVKGNVITDIQQSGSAESIRHAIYLDEFAEGWLVESNLAVNCTHPMLNHIARGNTVRNNVFVSDGELKISFIRCKDYKVENNILMAKGGVVLAGNPDAIKEMGSNLLYSLTGEYAEYHIDDRYRYYETVPMRLRDGSVTADPLFVDAGNDDYYLGKDSPAIGLGIVSIDASIAGRRKTII